jgi:hypothetical protein
MGRSTGRRLGGTGQAARTSESEASGNVYDLCALRCDAVLSGMSAEVAKGPPPSEQM